MTFIKTIINGIFKENPIFVLFLAICHILAVTTSVFNALGMGLATTFVLTCSNILISLMKDFVPTKIRIPCYIVVIASFATICELVLEAFVPELHRNLGIFLPLIVVNCIILGRAEAFASKNTVFNSMGDGIGMGIGFTLALMLVGTLREFIGAGSIFDIPILPLVYRENPVLVVILAPGAFITLGLLMGLINHLKGKIKR
jgi:electron transport complex protein RnfE